MDNLLNIIQDKVKLLNKLQKKKEYFIQTAAYSYTLEYYLHSENRMFLICGGVSNDYMNAFLNGMLEILES